MSQRPASHPLWVFIPKGTPIRHSDRGFYDPENPENQTQDDCTTIIYRHKRYGRWSPQAFTEHDGVPGSPWRVYLDWKKCTKLKDGGTLNTQD